MLAYVVSTQGVSQIMLQRLSMNTGEQRDDPRGLTGLVPPRPGRGFGGGCWCWSHDATAIVYAAVDGNLWWQPLDATAARRLTDHGPERVAQAPVATGDGLRIVYVVDQAEVWSVHLGDGVSERLDDGSADFCFDPCALPDASGAIWLGWNIPDMPWDHARVIGTTFTGQALPTVVARASLQQPRTMSDGRRLMVCDDHGWNNLWLDGSPLVEEQFEHGGPTWGLGQRSFVSSPDDRWVAFTRNEHGFGRLCIVEVASGTVHEIARGVHGQLSWAGNRLAALRAGARTPTQIVVYDLAFGLDGVPVVPLARTTVAIGPDPAWSHLDLGEPEVVEIPTNSGGVIYARLYRSTASQGDEGQGAGASPDAGPDAGRLICWLHGGPTDQWQVTFMPRIAYWCSRGWNILVPDHRGSTGHGRAYQQALDGRWGELDVEDVASAVRYAHAAGWGVAPQTVLIGGSAGGFTVLGVVRRCPELAAAAVVAYPVTDLADLAERSHRFERHSTWTLVGDPTAPGAAERYRDRSPVWFAERITTPLLVFHGADDPVVPVGQSRLLVERIRALGGAVELCVYPGEGHGFRQRDHQLDEYRRTEEFMRRHVG